MSETKRARVSRFSREWRRMSTEDRLAYLFERYGIRPFRYAVSQEAPFIRYRREGPSAAPGYGSVVVPPSEQASDERGLS